MEGMEGIEGMGKETGHAAMQNTRDDLNYF